MNNNWYLIKPADENISQGDIIVDCPIFVPNSEDINYSDPEWYLNVEIGYDTYIHDVVVMTQACDLERDPVSQVLVARIEDVNVINFPGPSKGQTSSRNKYIEQIYNGRKPNLHLIGANEDTIQLNYQVVDFTSVFSIPYIIINDFVRKRGPRLRLNTPHREYLSQRFGSFYSRIGLPNEDHITQADLLAKVNKDLKEYQDPGDNK